MTSQEIAPANTSSIAIRWDLWSPGSTRGRAPFWSCLARWKARVTKRNLLSSVAAAITTLVGPFALGAEDLLGTAIAARLIAGLCGKGPWSRDRYADCWQERRLESG